VLELRSEVPPIALTSCVRNAFPPARNLSAEASADQSAAHTQPGPTAFLVMRKPQEKEQNWSRMSRAALIAPCNQIAI
jgi:hypothetical protein